MNVLISKGFNFKNLHIRHLKISCEERNIKKEKKIKYVLKII